MTLIEELLKLVELTVGIVTTSGITTMSGMTSTTNYFYENSNFIQVPDSVIGIEKYLSLIVAHYQTECSI